MKNFTLFLVFCLATGIVFSQGHKNCYAEKFKLTPIVDGEVEAGTPEELQSAVTDFLGADYVVAEWDSLTKFISTEQDLIDFTDTLGINVWWQEDESDMFWLTYKGQTKQGEIDDAGTMVPVYYYGQFYKKGDRQGGGTDTLSLGNKELYLLWWHGVSPRILAQNKKSTCGQTTTIATTSMSQTYGYLSNGFYHIQSKELIGNVDFYNLSGALVLKAGNQANINVSGLSKGVYLVKVNSLKGNLLKTQKVLIK